MTGKCHEVPAFGCSTCIDGDRMAWIDARVEAWKSTYRFKNCARCGGPTKVWETETCDDKTISIIIGCASDDDGGQGCSDEDYSVDIPC